MAYQLLIDGLRAWPEGVYSAMAVRVRTYQGRCIGLEHNLMQGGNHFLPQERNGAHHLFMRDIPVAPDEDEIARAEVLDGPGQLPNDGGGTPDHDGPDLLQALIRHPLPRAARPPLLQGAGHPRLVAGRVVVLTGTSHPVVRIPQEAPPKRLGLRVGIGHQGPDLIAKVLGAWGEPHLLRRVDIHLL